MEKIFLLSRKIDFVSVTPTAYHIVDFVGIIRIILGSPAEQVAVVIRLAVDSVVLMFGELPCAGILQIAFGKVNLAATAD